MLRFQVIEDGEARYEDQFVGVVKGLFTLLGAEEGLALANRAQEATASGATADAAAAFRVVGPSRVDIEVSDFLIMIQPHLEGRFQVAAQRWTPMGTRLVLTRP
ncbi:hypothetical protein [Pseudonocardia sp. D17]|uniref:hypothetical protein n=1 Tax=Pseudonocardia sp. D17 TaxID=882661 RepID=UPI002B3E2C29|nr:hypothetical protein PSD17_28220 [Pseudonocardia sp. D17]